MRKLYGNEFSRLSISEKEYLIINFKLLRKITQEVLARYAPSRIPSDINEDSSNTIEFYLHMDGSISDIKFIQMSKIAILNDTTKEVIELAHVKYPRPKEKTLVRYHTNYELGKK